MALNSCVELHTRSCSVVGDDNVDETNRSSGGGGGNEKKHYKKVALVKKERIKNETKNSSLCLEFQSTLHTLPHDDSRAQHCEKKTIKFSLYMFSVSPRNFMQ